jgi:hypothetical protein
MVAEEYAYILQAIARRNPYLCSRYSAKLLKREQDYFSRKQDLSKTPLWCGGFWVLPRGVSRSGEFLDAWWSVVTDFSVFDQGALGALLFEYGIDVVPLPVDIYDNVYFSRVAHA